MTEAEVRAEIQDCGLDHLSTSRVDRFANLAARKVYNTHLWPFRLTSTSGASPLDVSFRGPIRFVTNEDGDEVAHALREDLERAYPDITVTSGSAEAWYLDDNRYVATFPATAETITVRHYRLCPTSTTDILTAIPETFHYLVVLDAVRRGKAENDELEAAAIYKADYDAELLEMRRILFNEQVQNPRRLNDV